jgi:hypothetical protein
MKLKLHVTPAVTGDTKQLTVVQKKERCDVAVMSSNNY